MIRGKSLLVFDVLQTITWWFLATSWALSALAQSPTFDQADLLRLLSEVDPSSLRAAGEALQNTVPKSREKRIAVADAVKSALSSTRDAAAQRSLRLALGKLAAAGVEDATEWGFESMSVTHNAKTPPEVFEAHARALEMVPGAAKELMIGNLDVALNFPDADPKERQRLKEFVTLTAEALKTRELAIFLDALLTGEEDLFVKIEAPLEVRLIACYKNVRAEPPINADAIVQWLEKHPGGPPEVEIAALDAISTVGSTDSAAPKKLAEQSPAKPENAVAIAKRIIDGRFDRCLARQVQESLKRHLTTKEKRIAEIEKQISELSADLEKLK